MSLRNVDRLSMLPEEIVSLILSLMPTKFAVRTSVLNKRWRCSWMFVTNLDFDDIHSFHELDTFLKFVNRVLEFCKTSQVHLFRLHLSKVKVPKSVMSKWIDTAVRLNVHELDIHVHVLLEFPLSLSTCKTLTKLRLDLGDFDDMHYEFSCPVNLPCLKTLDIVSYSKLSDNAYKLIHGCPMLESLSLEVTSYNQEEDYFFNIPTLKRLKLSFINGLRDTVKVVLELPILEYLCVGGGISHSSVIITVDMSSLVEAHVSFNNITYGRSWFELLNRINRVQSLSAQFEKFPNYFSDPFTSLPTFVNMKHLELKGVHPYGLISQFLENCPELKNMCIEKTADQNFQTHKKSSWIKPNSVPVCMLTNLTIIKLTNCNGTSSEMQFLEYVLSKAEVLKTVTVTWGNFCMDDETRLCGRLLKVSRASRRSLWDSRGDLKLKCLKTNMKLEESSLIEPKSVPACMLKSLATITIKFQNARTERRIQFLEYMLRNADSLKTVTIILGNLFIEDETRLCAQLLKLPKASRNCEIRLI